MSDVSSYRPSPSSEGKTSDSDPTPSRGLGPAMKRSVNRHVDGPAEDAKLIDDLESIVPMASLEGLPEEADAASEKIENGEQSQESMKVPGDGSSTSGKIKAVVPDESGSAPEEQIKAVGDDSSSSGHEKKELEVFRH